MASWQRRRPLPISGPFPALRLGIPPAHASGQGWEGGQRATGARLDSLSLSHTHAPPARAQPTRERQPASASQQTAAAGAAHLQSELSQLLRDGSSSTGIVDPLGGAGGRVLLHGLTASRLAELKKRLTARRRR